MTPPTVEYRIIPLTRGKIAYVSPRAYGELIKYKWQVRKHDSRYYAARAVKIDGLVHTVFMHRQILGLDEGNLLQGDHRNSKRTLDNTDGNLRNALPANQCWNRGKQKDSAVPFKGVCMKSPTSRGKLYRARIMANGKRLCLGSFDTPEEAYAAYCVAAKELHGEFACLG